MSLKIRRKVYTKPDRKTGKRVRKITKMWYVVIDGKLTPLSTDKRAAEIKALRLIRLRDAGYDFGAMEKAKFQSVHDRLREFEEAQKEKGAGKDHIRDHLSKLRRVFEHCGITTLGDIDAQAIDAWLAQYHQSGECSARTRVHFVAVLKTFGNFLERSKSVIRNPFAELTTRGINADAHPAYERDAFTPEEAERLLDYVSHSKTILLSLEAPHRALLYQLGLDSGLRRNELGSLTPESFDLAGPEPVVIVESRHAKNRRKAVLPLRTDLAAKLREWLATKAQGEILFPIRNKDTSTMIRTDCTRAGIQVIRPNGRHLDFHSLRVSLCTHLGLNGVSLAMTQKLMRHSTPALTSGIYSKFSVGQLAAALDSLPPRK